MSKHPATDPERQGWTSASNAEADILCPGRYQACKGLSEPAAQPDAERGTRVHDWLAGKGNPLSAEEMDCAQQLSEKAIAWVDHWLANTGNRASYYREQRLWLDIGPLQHSGKPDLLVHDEGNHRALIIDYKTGWDDITESNRNGQLRDLAVLAANAYTVMEVTVGIVQPYHKPQLCRYDLSDLATARKLLELRVRACHEPNAPRIAGKDQCKYCLAVQTCKEHHAWLAPVLKDEAEFPATSIRQWTPEKRAWFCERKAAIRKRLDTWEDEIKAILAEDPNAVPGWKLGTAAVRETINDPQTVHERFITLATNAGVHDSREVLTAYFLKTLKVNKGDLKETVGQLLAARGKQLEEIMRDLTAGCVQRKTCSAPLEEV